MRSVENVRRLLATIPPLKDFLPFVASANCRSFSRLCVVLAIRGARSDEEKLEWAAVAEAYGIWGARLMLPAMALMSVPFMLLLHFLLNLHKLPTWFRRLHSTRSVTVSPPLAADYLLSLFLSRQNKSETIGDLTEEFREEIVPAFGLKAAWFWYWKKALSAVVERNPIVRKFLIGGSVLKAGAMIWKLFAG